MKKAAFDLRSDASAVTSHDVHFLTGKRFWFQTAFCLHSLQRNSRLALNPVFYDDGTLDSITFGQIASSFPYSKVETAGQIRERLDISLPKKEFPALRRQRETYKHLRKLTDIHAGRPGWNLVLDSDMLFFRQPIQLETWLDKPERACLMTDVQNAYGYPNAVLEGMSKTVIPNRLNVGICGLSLKRDDWLLLEEWTARLLREHGSSYYLEQALVALLVAGRNPLLLPTSDYKIMPSMDECLRPSSVLHHYADLSKRGYFRHAWRHIL